MATPSELDDIEEKIADGTSEAYPEPLSAKELAEGTFPPPTWTVADFVLFEEVNLLYGKGGAGKSTVATQMAVCVAAGKKFFKHRTIQASALLVLSEDTYHVTQERAKAQCEVLGVKLEDLPMKFWCLRGSDLSLAKITEDGGVTFLPFFKALKAKMGEMPPGSLVVLDGLADVAQMSEKDRIPVTAFMKKVLGKLSVKFGATILVLGHPSKASENDGSWHSGSTAFVNAVRNMLVMKEVKDTPSYRTLGVHKSNYGEIVTLTMRWSAEIFRTLDAKEVQKDEQAKAEIILAKVLELIDTGQQVTNSNRSGGYNPKKIAKLINKARGLSVTDDDVVDVMLASHATLVYTKRWGSTPAGYSRRETEEAEAPLSNLMQPLVTSEIVLTDDEKEDFDFLN